MYAFCMSSKTINLSLPEELLKEVDALARSNYASRSDYVRQVLVEKINARISEEEAWADLSESADEVAEAAEKAGYVTDADFNRLAREIKEDRQDCRTQNSS